MSRYQKVTLARLNELAAIESNQRFANLVRLGTRPNGQADRFTFVDLLSGAGGSSVGFWLAGGNLVGAYNHSQVMITTHAVNFPDITHECVDLDHYDMRNLPKADVLWASVICTEISPAGGRKRNRKLNRNQLALLEAGAVEDEAWERTRATALDVLRAAEVHRFKYIAVENVVEFGTDWPLFAWWLKAFEILGYRWQVINVSSAHIGGDDIEAAPQWRDRMYIVLTRKDMVDPHITPRPTAWCGNCAQDVAAVQWWKDPAESSVEGILLGKYGANGQYLYRCPTDGCGKVVKPYVRAAAEIIDWSDLGQRIGDRKRPLVPNTMARIQLGLEMFGRPAFDRLDCPPLLVPSGGSWNGGRNGQGAVGVDVPMRTRTTREWEGLFTPPPGAWIDVLRNNAVPTSPHGPIPVVAAQGNHHAVVVPYRRGNLPTLTSDPFAAMSTHDSAALLGVELNVEDCTYRMVSPREQASAQAFPTSFALLGTRGEQTMAAGNAVSCNVAQFIGNAIAEVIR